MTAGHLAAWMLLVAGTSAAAADPRQGPPAEPVTEVSITPLAAQEATLRTTLAPTAAVISRSGPALELSYPVRLAFAPDELDLLPAGMAMLDLLAHSLKQYDYTGVVVAVYTDALGGADYNVQQSQARAAAVVDYLEKKGVDARRLTAKGAGESAPLEAPNTPEGRDLNRRLKVTITPLSS